MFKHSKKELSNKDIKELKLGEVAVSLSKGSLYTKAYDGTGVRVGDSARKASELKDYVVGSKSTRDIVSLLKVKTNDTGIYISNEYPFISIRDIKGFNIDDSTLDEADYLKVININNVVNSAKKQYFINELGDVATNINKSSVTDNYVLSSTYIGAYNANKDPFKTAYYTIWQLKPEASQLKAFDDVYYTNPQSFDIITNAELNPQNFWRVRNYPLSIYWDKEPKLSANLDFNYNSVLSLNYATNTIDTVEIVSTVICDIDSHSFYVINCTNTAVLNIGIKYNPNFDSQGVKLAGLVINNFKGVLRFNNKVEFENGIPPILTGECNIFNLVIYQDSSSIITKVLHKGNNLNNV